MANPTRNAQGFLAGSNQNDMTPSAILEARSTEKGVLVPRVTEAQRDAITVGAPQNGLLVFVTDASEPGFQFYDHPSTSWKAVASGNFIPIGGTNENDPVTGLIEFESGSDRGFFSINPEIIDRRVVFSDEDDIRIRTQRLDEELQTAVFVRPGSFEVSTNDLTNSSNLSINPTESLLTSTNASYRGLEYGGNYSANFSPRSLVDKEYVDNAAAGGSTNLSYTPSTTEGTVNSDTGTDATIPAGSTTNASLMLPGDKTSLDSAKAVSGVVKSNGSGVFSEAQAGIDFEPAQTGTGFILSTGGGKTYISSTGTGNVVRETSPALLGTPTAPTAASGTNTTQIANTAFVKQELDKKAPAPSWMRLSSDRTLISQTAPQKIFNVGTNGNGAFQAKANTSYHFVIMAGLNSLSSTSGTFSFVMLGTANITGFYATAQAVKNNNGPANTSTTKMLSNTETVITVSSAVTNGRMLIEGYFTTGTAGTVIPAIGLSNAAAAVVEANAFARFVEVGSSTFTASSDID